MTSNKPEKILELKKTILEFISILE